MKDNLEHRMDNRSKEAFASDIKRDTEREKIAAIAIKNDLINKGKKVSFTDFGADNTGKIIEGFVNANPDYIFNIDGVEILVEIKVHSERYKCQTFKVCDLKRYLKMKSFLFVVVEGGYYIYDPKAIEIMLKEYSQMIYENFSPNDLAIRLNKSAISALKMLDAVRYREWHKDTFVYNDIFEKRKN